jgi:hypothetical protein
MGSYLLSIDDFVVKPFAMTNLRGNYLLTSGKQGILRGRGRG